MHELAGDSLGLQFERLPPSAFQAVQHLAVSFAVD
jgi:hypothetical protein